MWNLCTYTCRYLKHSTTWYTIKDGWTHWVGIIVFVVNTCGYVNTWLPFNYYVACIYFKILVVPLERLIRIPICFVKLKRKVSIYFGISLKNTKLFGWLIIHASDDIWNIIRIFSCWLMKYNKTRNSNRWLL